MKNSVDMEGSRSGRASMCNEGNGTDVEQRQKDKEDAHKYRTRKEVRDQLVFYAAIIGATGTVLYTLMQMIGGSM